MNAQAQIHFENSLMLFNAGKFKGSLDQINQALELVPEQAEYRILRARIYLETHKSARAIQELQAIIEQGEQLAEAFFQLGCVYDSIRNWEEAVAQFTQAIQHAPERTEAYERRALSNWFLNQYEAAVQDYAVVLQRQPHNGLAYINRGRARYALEDYSAALRDLAQGLYYRSYMTALILWSRADWRIMAELDAIIDRMPDNADVYFLRGHVYETHTGVQIPKAIGDYSRAIALCPDRPVFYLFRSRAYFKQNNLDRAWEDIQIVLTSDPIHIDALILRGKIAYQQGDHHQAQMDWRAALDQNPHHMEADWIKTITQDM